MYKNTLYLINPKANEKNALKNWRKLQSRFPMLPKEPLDITKFSDITLLLKDKKPELLVIAGGDGTVNFVVNVVLELKQKPILAIFPLGFGNALAYCLGVETATKAIDVIERRPSKLDIDVIKTNIPNHPVSVFNMSVGFDARVVHNRINYRYIGFWSYVLSAITSFIVHPEKEIRFTIDKRITLRATASGLVIANCPIIGQNHLAYANAKLNDGFLDCTLFSTKYDYITNLRVKGFKHPLYSELGKTYFKAKHLRIEGDPFVQIDGDPDMLTDGGLELSIMPRAVTFLKNATNQINQVYLPFIE